jgi:uncharacterized protein (DUF1015 family)
LLEVKATNRLARVYNFMVDEARTYFVGGGQWLVHNCLTVKTSEFNTTHGLTMSNRQFTKFVGEISENGIDEPIKVVMHNEEMYVVDGHHRLQAARHLGIQDVPVKIVELPYKGYKIVADLFDR